MSENIAPLGFFVDTEGLAKAEASVNKAAQSFEKLGDVVEKNEKVTNDSIKKTEEHSKALEKEAEAANKASDSLKKHADNVQKSDSEVKKATASTEKLKGSTDQVARAMDFASQHAQKFGLSFNSDAVRKYAEEASKAGKIFDATGAGSWKMNEAGKALTDTSKKLATGLSGSTQATVAMEAATGASSVAMGGAAIAAGVLVGAVAAVAVAVGAAAKAGVGLIEAQIPIEERFKAITRSAEGAKVAMDAAFSNSRDNSSPLEFNQTSLQTIMQARDALGLTSDMAQNLQRELDRINQLSGSASQAIVGFTSSMVSGLRDGAVSTAELSAWLQQSPALAEALEAGLGKNITAIKQMASEGRLFSEVFVNGLIDGSERVNQKFGEMPKTVASAKAAIKVEWDDMLMQLAKATGFHELEVSFYESIKKGIMRARDFFEGLEWKPPSGAFMPTGVPGLSVATGAPSGDINAPKTTGWPVLMPRTGMVMNDDVRRLVQTVYGESGTGTDANRDVASVILNRAKLSRQSVKDVVLAQGQFEPWMTRAGRDKMENMSPQNFQRVLTNLMPLLTGESGDTTGGATLFYSPGGQAAMGRNTPSWARGKQPLKTANGHVFLSGAFPGQSGRIPTINPSEPTQEEAQTAGILNTALSSLENTPAGNREAQTNQLARLRQAYGLASGENKRRLGLEISRMEQSLLSPIDRQRQQTALIAQGGGGGGGAILQNAFSLNQASISQGVGSNMEGAMAAATDQAVANANNAVSALERQVQSQKAVNATIGQSREAVRAAQVEQQTMNFAMERFGNIVTPATIAATGRYRTAIMEQMKAADEAKVSQQEYEASLSRSINTAEAAALAEGKRGYEIRKARMEAQAAVADEKMPGTGGIVRRDFASNENVASARSRASIEDQIKAASRQFQRFYPQTIGADGSETVIVSPTRTAANPFDDRMVERYQKLQKLRENFQDGEEQARKQQEAWDLEDKNRDDRRAEADVRSLQSSQEQLRIAGLTRQQREIETALVQRRRQLIEAGSLRPNQSLSSTDVTNVTNQVAATRAVDLQSDYTQTAERDEMRLAATRAQLDLVLRVGQERRIQVAIIEREADLISRGLLQPGERLNEAEAERLSNVVKQTEQYERQKQYIEDLNSIIPQTFGAMRSGLNSITVEYFEKGRVKAEDLAKTAKRVSAQIAADIVDKIIIKPLTDAATKLAEKGINSLLERIGVKGKAANDNKGNVSEALKTAATNKSAADLAKNFVVLNGVSTKTTAGLVGLRASSASSTKALVSMAAAATNASKALMKVAASSAGKGGKEGGDKLSSFAQFLDIATSFAAHGDIVNDNHAGAVYNSPRLYMASSGATIGHEAGPEAIMPLQRGPDGKLGIANYGSGGGGEVKVVVNDYRSGGEKAEVQSSTNSDGKREIYITVRDTVKHGLAAGDYDKEMGSAYGSSRMISRR